MKQLDPLNGLIIGLTGGIACGKSTVTQLLQRRGADIIDLDQIGHELLKANSPVMKQLLKTFGPEVLDLSGDVNRTKLGKIVFADPLTSGPTDGPTDQLEKWLCRSCYGQ